MSSTQDLATVAQSNVDVLIALSTKAFEGAEKLAALNLKVAKAGLAEAAESSQAVLASKDAQSLLAVQSGVVQPAAAKAGEYATAVAAIMTETKTELASPYVDSSDSTAPTSVSRSWNRPRLPA